MASVVHAILQKKRKWWGYYRTPEERAAILIGHTSNSEAEGLVKQGKLEKRGARVGDAWNPRWVTLAQDELCYYYYDETTTSPGPVIDRIPIHEVERVITEQEYAAQENARAGAGTPESEEDEPGRPADVRRDAKWKKSMSRRDLIAQSSESAFLILTRENGEKEGRKYRFQAATVRHMRDWMDAINKTKAGFQPNVETTFEKTRAAVRIVYESTQFQVCVAIAIFINFMCNAVEAELLPEKGSDADRVLQAFDLIFVALFTIELAINLFANLLAKFIADGWNYFDTFVVIISLVATFADENPGLNVLRMVRAFRVFRLFRRVRDLRKIIRAINQSLPAVGNAFFLVLLMTSIYAIMGTSFFRLQYPASFNSFSISMYTMFQIMTFDDSAEVTLDIMALQSNGSDAFLVVLFTISFQLFVGFILCNIVMAVLLEKFTEASDASKQEEQQEARAAELKKSNSVLDPILEQLSRVETEEQLNRRIEEIFHFIDEDDSGQIDFQEMRSGLKRMDTDPLMDFKPEDWNELVVNRGLATQCGQIDLAHFTTFINVQLREYIHRQMARAAGEVKQDEKLTAILRSLQQTAFVTCNSQELINDLMNKMASMKTDVASLQRKVDKVKQKSQKSGTDASGMQNGLSVQVEFKESDPDQVRQAVSWSHDAHHARAATAVNIIQSTDQVFQHSQPLLQSASPGPTLFAVTPGAGETKSMSGTLVSGSVAESNGTLGTSTPMLSPMMSPLVAAPNTHPGHLRTDPVAATPQSLLASAPPSKKRDASYSRGGSVDVLDIRGLNARVDAMQSRLVYTIQQAKLAREKTRNVFARRRAQEEEGGTRRTSTYGTATPSSLLRVNTSTASPNVTVEGTDASASKLESAARD